MKKALFLLMLLMALKPALPLVDYVVNYEYVSKVLCVNKDKPKMHCNGKCHLMKELAKEAEKEKPLSSNKKVTPQESEVLFIEPIKKFQFKAIQYSKAIKKYYFYTNFYTSIVGISVFHPPTLIS